MLKAIKEISKQILFIPLFIFSSATLSQSLTFGDAIQLTSENGVITIPDNYTYIGADAFYGVTAETVVIPESVTGIASGAFQYSNLEYLTLPHSVTSINNSTFQNSLIESITLHAGITSIGNSAFRNTKLKEINLPDGVVIGNYAFGNTEIEHLLIPDDAQVGSRTFENIPLKSLELGRNLVAYGDGGTAIGIFSGSTSNLKTVILNGVAGCARSSSYGFCFDNEYNPEFVVLRDAGLQFRISSPNTTIVANGSSFVSGGDALYMAAKKVIVVEPITMSDPLVRAPHEVCENIDTDNDGHQDCYDQFPNDPDRWFDYGDESNNTPQSISNDSDGDGILDTFDSDSGQNNCYEEDSFVGFNLDTDQDGIVNRDDCDDDNDGLFDIYEPFFGTNPLLADSDFDGTLDGLDAFPLDNTESLDTDSDGIGNNADTDDDNDGYTDFLDAFPTDATEWADSDLDGIGNNSDPDDDNDGVADTEDAFPHTATESLDSDNDGVGDNADAFPNDATEVADTDLDGIGNNADPDDDNDGVADADDGDPINADIGIQPSQLISVAGNPVGVNGHSTRISLSYDTSDGDNQLPGIGFRLHYSSEMLSFAGTENTIADDIIVDGDGPYQDDSDYDNDSNTDKYIIFGWAALNGDWPNSSLPASLVDVVFNVNWEAFDQASITTPINFSKVSTTEGYNFEATNYTLNVLPATWDFDGNGQADALTDGLILLRHAFGVRGASLTDSVMATDSTMTSNEVQVAVEKALVIADVDGDGNVDALTDGLIVLRYMFGLTGDTLMDGVVSANATRASAESVQQHIELYMPNNLLAPVQSEQSFIVGDWKLAGVPDKREYEEGVLQDWNFYGSAYSQAEFDVCVTDDIYRFGENGTFEYLINGFTYMDEELNPLYYWNDSTSSSCVIPLAPWNEDQIYTYSIDQNNSLLTVNGYGAYIALAHVANGTDDLETAADAPESITYDFTKLSDTEVLLEIDAYTDFYRFTLEKVVN